MSKKNKIVVLTGAGISAEAGIKTFRDSEGLWEDHKVEDVATYTGFIKNPRLVYKFYNERRKQLLNTKIHPTKAHLSLKELEDNYDGDVVVITQNVDDLHERSGTKNLIHMHGELLKMKCLQSGKTFEILSDLSGETLCSCCQVPSRLRPDIVWFGETPYQMNEIEEHLKTATTYISIGTSAMVYPAAMFINMISKDCESIEINLDKTGASWRFNQNFIGMASKEVPLLVSKLLLS